MSDAVNGPLAGIRVVDLTRILAGPLCTMMLGDMGADIIKVEPPDKGDDTRGWGPPFVAGEAAYFLGVNRNKRSLTLNMAVPAGQRILAGLIEKADVLIDNFRLGTLAKWGFTDAWFEQQAPRLVRCAITGYGSSGPKAALPGYIIYSMAEFTSLFSINNIAGLSTFIRVIIGLAVTIGFLVVMLSMYTAILERTREIGILKSLGASQLYIVGIVIRETVLLALLGIGAGIVFSFGAQGIIQNRFPILVVSLHQDWWLYAGLIAVGGAMLGALYPAVRAARQDPIAALAYE